MSAPLSIEAAFAALDRAKRIEAAAERWATLSADPRTPRRALLEAERKLREAVAK